MDSATDPAKALAAVGLAMSVRKAVSSRHDGQSSVAPRVHLSFLDGIRGLASLYVVLHHVWLASFPRQAGGSVCGICLDAPDWSNWLKFGHLAVAVFIVVSGFSLALFSRAAWRPAPGGVCRVHAQTGLQNPAPLLDRPSAVLFRRLIHRAIHGDSDRRESGCRSWLAAQQHDRLGKAERHVLVHRRRMADLFRVSAPVVAMPPVWRERHGPGDVLLRRCGLSSRQPSRLDRCAAAASSRAA